MKFSRVLVQGLFLFIALGASSLYAAFQGPVAPPPAGNVPAPLNVGTSFQQKGGPLWASAIGTDAGFCIQNSCITSWSQVGKTSCPAGFTAVTNAKVGRTLGCIENVTQKSTYEQAINRCFDSFGARLPSYAELSIIKRALSLTLPADMLLDGSAPAGNALAPSRCFIPAGA